MHKKAILLINLGTPKSATPMGVIRYLREFLADPRVIDIPALWRWVLVNLIIIPMRFLKTTHAYQQIWTSKGSPLLLNSLALKKALAKELGEEFQVELGMRYGQPKIQQALNNLKSCDSIHVIALFPQYSSAATGSAIAKVLLSLSEQWNIPHLTIQKDFYDNLGFINAYAQIIKNNIDLNKTDLILFSYHGLPERHLNKSQCQAKCNKIEPCPEINSHNLNCYRAQCYVTSDLIAKSLGLNKSQYQVCFQSRLGKTPWIKPYTDLLLPELIQKNIRNIAIACPSFVADCLETLEEVNIRLRKDWVALGGKEFKFIPSLNANPIWVTALAKYIKDPKA